MFGDEYPEMADQLRANVSRFSAYKANYVRQAFDDNARQFSDKDLDDANRATINQFRRWTDAELTTAGARARTAKQFTEFNEPDRRELFPCLKWLPSRAVNPRQSHMRFYNRVWRKDDTFWDNNAPGTEWNCMCDIEECDDQPTDNSKVKQPDIPKGLEGNPSVTGEIFTDKASYFTKCQNPSVPEDILKPIMARHDEFVKYLKDNDYKDQKFDWESLGYQAIHKGHNLDKKKGWYENEVAEAGMKAGNVVILENELGGAWGERFTEGTWNKEKFEVSGRETATENNILKGLKHCARKRATKIAVLDFPMGGFSKEIVEQAIIRYKGLKKVKDFNYVEFSKIVCVQEKQVVYETL